MVGQAGGSKHHATEIIQQCGCKTIQLFHNKQQPPFFLRSVREQIEEII